MIAALCGALLVPRALAAADPTTLEVDARGDASTAVAFDTPAFYGLTPAVALRYNASAGPGLAGAGWNLVAGSQITRRSATGGIARMDASDRFFLDGDELIACAAGSTSPSCTTAITAFGAATGFYSTRTESYARARQDAAGWTLWSPDGKRADYTTVDGGASFQVRTVTDSFGNHVDYTWACSSGCELDRISYGTTEVRFYREDRPDPRRERTGAGAIWRGQRLRSVVVRNLGALVRAYQLGYADSLGTGASLLTSVQQFGRDATIAANGQVSAGPTPPLPAVTFRAASQSAGGAWSLAAETSSPALFDVSAPPPVPLASRYPDGTALVARTEVVPDPSGDPTAATTTDNAVVSGDFDGDGRDELATWALRAQCSKIAFRVHLTDNAGGAPTIVDAPVQAVGSTAPCANQHATKLPLVLPADVNNDGATDLIVGYGRELRRFVALGTGSFRAGPVTTWSATTRACAVGDVDGDGRDDLACEDPTARQLVVRRTTPSGWVTSTIATSTTAAPSLPDHTGLTLAAGDVDGDGLADLVVTRPNGTSSTRVVLGRSRGDGTFDWSEEQTFALTGALQLADVDGDGRTDLTWNRGNATSTLDVAVSRKGYGTGRWRLLGRQSVAMSMLQFADVDGDGDADLIGRPLGSDLAVAPAVGDGAFGAVGPGLATCTPSSTNLSTLMAGDWNGDGLVDPVCLAIIDGNQAQVYERPSPARGVDRHRWRRADLDGDGRPELIYVAYRNPGYQITVVVPHTGLRYTYTATTITPGLLREPDAGRWIVADVGSPAGPGDGRDDLILVEHVGGRLVTTTLFSTGLASFTAIEHDVTAAPDRSTDGWFGAIDGRDGRAMLERVIGQPTNVAGVRVDRLRPIGPGRYSFTRGTYFTGGAAPLTDRAARGFKPADVDGDGLTDLVQIDAIPRATPVIRSLRPDGNGGLVEATAILPIGSLTGSRAARVVDLDGDGADDVVQIARAPVTGPPCLAITHLAGDGKGGFAAGDRGGLACLSTTDPLYNRLFEDAASTALLDLDRDGEPELVHVSHAVDAGGQRRLVVARIRRDRSGPVPQWRASTYLPALAYDNGDAWRWQPYRDATSGDIGLWYLHPQVSLTLRWSRVRDELITADNGLGRAATISYAPYLGTRAAMPAGVIPRVVTRIETTDRAVAPTTTDAVVFSYTGATWSYERGLIGFATTSANDGAMVSVGRYALGDACGVQLTQREVRNLAGATFRYSTTAYEAPGSAPYHCAAASVTDVECELAATCRTARTRSFTRDASGNLRQAYDLADRAVTTATVTSFVINPTAYILDRPSERYVFALGTSEWTTLSRVAWRYDQLAAGSPPVRGAITARAEYDDQTGTFPTTAYEYDPRGNLVRTVSPEGRITTALYDGWQPTEACDAHQCAHTAYDPVTRQPVTVTDANQAIVTTSYDAHGRVVRVDRPDHSYTRTAYLDFGGFAAGWSARQRIRTEVSDGTPDGLWSEQWFDGSGRTRRASAEGGATTTTEFADGSDRPSRVSLVHDAALAPARWERFDYDGSGRLIRATHPDNTFRSRSFAVGAITETDEVDNTTVRRTDGRDQVVEIVDGLGHTSTIAIDGAGRVLGTTDALGNRDTSVYSTRGLRVATNDPDRGLRQYTYTADGLLASSVDAKHQQLLFTYDDLGRTSLRRDLDGSGLQVRKVSFRYDDGAAGHGASRGRLYAIEDTQRNTAIAEERWYDELGRVTEVRRCVDGICMTEGTTFDLAGRIASERYPDASGFLAGGTEVVRQYGAAGDLELFGDLAALRFTQDHLLERMELINQVGLRYTHDPARRWVDRIDVLGLVTASIGYEHDPLARISHQLATGQLDADLGYRYDAIGRLTDVDSTSLARREHFDYDEIGRIQWATGLGDYQYDDPTHVHALTATTSGATRSYDANGNVGGLYDASTSGVRDLALDWTADDRLATVEDQVTGDRHQFVYDVGGRRVKRVDRSGTTLYFGPHLELDDRGVYTRSYLIGDRLIARDRAGARSFYLQDLARNVRLVIDDGGNPVEQYEYSAFGVPFNPIGQSDIAFAGARSERALGLVLMGARTYDPTAGRFLSADSLIPSLARPQSLDRYAYVENDPVNYWDPSGHMRYLVELRKARIAEDANLDDSPEAVVAGAGALGRFMTIDRGLSLDDLLVIQRGHYKETYGTHLAEHGEDGKSDHSAASRGGAPGADHEAVQAAGGGSRASSFGGTRGSMLAMGVASMVTGGLPTIDDVIDEALEQVKWAFYGPCLGIELFLESDHDVFVMAGGGFEPKDFLPHVEIGPIDESLVLVGHSNHAGGYVEGLKGHGWHAEFRFLGEKFEIAGYGAIALTAEGPKFGVMADVTLGNLSYGAYSFGLNTKDTGTYGALKIGKGFVGAGMSLETNPFLPFGSINSAWKAYQASKQ